MGEGQALPEGVSPAPGPRNQAVSLCGCSEGTSRCPPGPSSAVGKVLRNQKWEQLRSALASQNDSSSMPLPVSFSLWRWAGGVGPAWWWALVQGPVLTGASSRRPCRGCRGPGETALTRFFSLALVTAAFLSFLRGRGGSPWSSWAEGSRVGWGRGNGARLCSRGGRAPVPLSPSCTLSSTWDKAAYGTVGVSASHRPRCHLQEAVLAGGPHPRRPQAHVGWR